ncbi:hypothetical protein M1O56_02735 [Dehalococcoidia bacterium]|nr:hypothetical protein [Dehalococcoidia bacterium]
MDMGPIVGIIGAVVGLSIGVVVTYREIKHAKTPAERKIIMKSLTCMGIAAILLAVIPLVLSHIGIIPAWLAWMTFGLFFILLVPVTSWEKKRRAALRGEKA